MNNKTLIHIAGPTAIGKTSLSIALAQAMNTEIISCDSRQFYKEMSIGTAVPSPEELASAPHHFIQHISIEDEYSVGDYEKEALDLCIRLFEKYDQLILVGGSGLYAEALIQGLDYFPEVPEHIKNQLKQELENNGLANLQSELEQVDPLSYQQIEIQNPHRVLRALGVYRASAKPFSSFKNKAKQKRPWQTIRIGLKAEREIIYERINRRVDLMMKAGLLEEAKTLYSKKELNALQTVGYRELFEYFDDKFSLDFAIEEIKKNTRRYAKRQSTWNKKIEGLKEFDYLEDPEIIVQYIRENL
jgi:tRNA dimethylallyltransferase